MKTCTLLFSLALLITACGGSGTTPPGGGPAPAAHDDGHGPRQALGSLTVGAHTFEVFQEGHTTAGKDTPIDLEFAAGAALPGTVRAWFGVESGEGSMKCKLAKEGDRTLHNHVPAPATLPAGSRLWIEIEENGQTARGSIAWK